MGNKTVIINATALGGRLNGIGMYLYSIITELVSLETDIRFIIYLNGTAKAHFRDRCFPSRIVIKYATRLISPDYGFPAHLLRLLYSNYLSLRHPRSLCFNGSQLEAMLFRRSQILMIHDIIPFVMRTGHQKQYFYFKFVLPGVLRSARAIITPSAAVKEQLKARYGTPDAKIHVIYHGTEHAVREASQAESSDALPSILFIGRINPHKNLGRLLEGFKTAQDVLSHQLIIVGVKDRRARCRPAGSGKIVFKGYVSEQEKAALFKAAALLVFPSLHEGFGLPPLEAMLNACPVVASQVSCIREICGDAAFYVDPEDPVSIAEGMRRVATDRKLREALIQRGLQRVQMFSWRTSAEHHLRLFLRHLNPGTEPLAWRTPSSASPAAESGKIRVETRLDMN